MHGEEPDDLQVCNLKFLSLTDISQNGCELAIQVQERNFPSIIPVSFATTLMSLTKFKSDDNTHGLLIQLCTIQVCSLKLFPLSYRFLLVNLLFTLLDCGM